MDLSKLPRLSETDKHAPPPQQADLKQQQAPPRAMPATYGPAAPAGADVWISIAIGALIQLMSTRFWSYAFSKLFGSEFTWTFSDPSGAPITYPQTVFFLGDLAMVLFGLVLIVEGIVFMFSRSLPLLMAALVLTVLATAFNLVYLIGMMSQGYGLQLMSALAVIFGVYIALSQWKMVSYLRAMRV
ncbi:MAG TPA: hypothetical protein VH518_08595 [Tepidisphaeraceae bacterium]|jgi:hypothetical protein